MTWKEGKCGTYVVHFVSVFVVDAQYDRSHKDNGWYVNC